MLHIKLALFEWHIFNVINACVRERTPNDKGCVIFDFLHYDLYLNLIKSIEIECMILFFIE